MFVPETPCALRIIAAISPLQCIAAMSCPRPAAGCACCARRGVLTASAVIIVRASLDILIVTVPVFRFRSTR
jgi:hypothetical protein